jgi:hypothetical protein
MVTQYGHHSVGLIVGVEFFLESGIRKLLLFQLLLKGDRRVICTENFRSKAFHVRGEVLVQ